jgi:hypothetical protein
MGMHADNLNGGSHVAAQKMVAYCTSSDGTLLWWDEIPPELKFNKYIASGYRANLSYCQCLGTLFSIHNETGASLLAVHRLPSPVSPLKNAYLDELTHSKTLPFTWGWHDP